MGYASGFASLLDGRQGEPAVPRLVEDFLSPLLPGSSSSVLSLIAGGARSPLRLLIRCLSWVVRRSAWMEVQVQV